MLCFNVKKRREKSSYFWKHFFERITNIGVISAMGMKETVLKIWKINKFNFVKSRLDYKRLQLDSNPQSLRS